MPARRTAATAAAAGIVARGTAARTAPCVDDGSGPAYEEVFNQLTGTVLRHSRNRGKGAALKTGIRHIGAAFPGRPLVCADPDGQHSVADIMRVAEALDDDIVLGT